MKAIIIGVTEMVMFVVGLVFGETIVNAFGLSMICGITAGIVLTTIRSLVAPYEGVKEGEDE